MALVAFFRFLGLGILVCALLQHAQPVSAQQRPGGTDREILKFAEPDLLKRARQGDAVAQMLIGGVWLGGTHVKPNPAHARYWLDLAARQNLSMAQVLLGELYEKGRLGGLPDYPTAARYYRMAADQNDPMGALKLAKLHFSGRGVPRDNTKAAFLMKFAADQNIPIAAHYYGDMLFAGLGIPRDAPEAFAYYKKGAEAGWPASARTIAAFYFKGDIVPRDTLMASKWLQVAMHVTDKNDQLLGQYIAAIWPNLSDDEKSEGEAFAKAFVAENEDKIIAARNMQ